jgi:hypothetical protein
MPTVFAHETWFTDGPFPTDWSFAGETLSLGLRPRRSRSRCSSA